MDGCSRAVNVDFLSQSSYPSSSPKDQESTITGLHHNLLHRLLRLSYQKTVHDRKLTMNIVHDHGSI
jgi:hypothetical protein